MECLIWHKQFSFAQFCQAYYLRLKAEHLAWGAEIEMEGWGLLAQKSLLSGNTVTKDNLCLSCMFNLCLVYPKCWKKCGITSEWLNKPIRQGIISRHGEGSKNKLSSYYNLYFLCNLSQTSGTIISQLKYTLTNDFTAEWNKIMLHYSCRQPWQKCFLATGVHSLMIKLQGGGGRRKNWQAQGCRKLRI